MNSLKVYIGFFLCFFLLSTLILTVEMLGLRRYKLWFLYGLIITFLLWIMEKLLQLPFVRPLISAKELEYIYQSVSGVVLEPLALTAFVIILFLLLGVKIVVEVSFRNLRTYIEPELENASGIARDLIGVAIIYFVGMSIPTLIAEGFRYNEANAKTLAILSISYLASPVIMPLGNIVGSWSLKKYRNRMLISSVVVLLFIVVSLLYIVVATGPFWALLSE